MAAVRTYWLYPFVKGADIDQASTRHWSFAFYAPAVVEWLGSVVVRAFDLRLDGREFNYRPRRCRVTTLGKLFTLKAYEREMSTPRKLL